MPVLDVGTVREQPSQCAARIEHIRGSYQEVIDFKLTLDEAEVIAASCDRDSALEKWYLFFARGGEAGHEATTSMILSP